VQLSVSVNDSVAVPLRLKATKRRIVPVIDFDELNVLDKDDVLVSVWSEDPDRLLEDDAERVIMIVREFELFSLAV
jgi:hypothetical protein